MATSGAYKNTAFTFCYSFSQAADPTQLFTGSFAVGEVKVINRNGTTTGSASNITTLPAHQSNGVFEINLTASEMNHDETLVVIAPASSDVLAETVSIVTLPTPSDISEVAQSAVSGVSDFQGSGGGATAAEVYTYFTDGTRENVFKADVSGLATQSSVDSIDTDVQSIGSDVSAILTDTNELQGNQNNWLTATGFSTHAPADVRNALQAVAGDFKATGFSTFDPASDSVTVGTNNDKSGYALSQSFPANFSSLIIGTGGDAGKVTTSNPAAGSGSAHTAQDVANLILATPANKLATDGSGRVTAENMRGTDGANTTAPDNASIASILADTNELQQNQGDWATATGFSTHSATDVRNALQAVSSDFKANVSGLASQSSVNTVDSVVDAIKAKTDQLNFTNPGEVDANAVSGGSGGGGGDDAATIYNYFVAGSREDAFKADVSGLSTFDPTSQTVTTDTDSRNASKANVSGLSTFDPATQTVTTDTASREASKANVSGLATSSDISALNNFDASSEDVTISTAQAQAIADEILKRSVTNTEDTADAHSLAAIVLCMLESQRAGTSWTIRKTDGTTFATKTLSLDGSANPVTGVT